MLYFIASDEHPLQWLHQLMLIISQGSPGIDFNNDMQASGSRDMISESQNCCISGHVLGYLE